MIKELKAFLLRGDVVTLAVAVIIAAAFGKIVGSLVEDIITPLIGMVLNAPDFSSLAIGADAEGKGGIRHGNFINAVVNFVIVGTVLFFVVKAAGGKPEDAK